MTELNNTNLNDSPEANNSKPETTNPELLQDTRPIINKVLVELLNLADDEIHDQSEIKDLGADSLDFVEIGMSLEKEFNIAIPDETMEKIRTVADLEREVNAIRIASK